MGQQPPKRQPGHIGGLSDPVAGADRDPVALLHRPQRFDLPNGGLGIQGLGDKEDGIVSPGSEFLFEAGRPVRRGGSYLFLLKG